nr:DNA/RNA non-specific endonuclease [Bacteroides heparinolyticus]
MPNWVAWHLPSEHAYGDIKRPGNAWHEDLDVPAPRATVADYKGSGWTRGHMCPAGDNKWDGEAMYNTFLFSNCCPQNANLNSGTWNQIEISTRRWAERWGDLYIVCGPILFRQEHETIGENNVVVPEAFFKVIVSLNNRHPKGIGFICRNTDGNRKKDLYVNSVKKVERITGITFFPHLPKELTDAVKNEADINDWE